MTDTDPPANLTAEEARVHFRVVAMFWRGGDPLRANLAAELTATVYDGHIPALTRITKDDHIMFGIITAGDPT